MLLGASLASACGFFQSLNDYSSSGGAGNTDASSDAITEGGGGSSAEAGPESGGEAGVACTSAADCDDHLDCTVDVCTNQMCRHLPNDAACTATSGGVCDVTNGCQYPTCTAQNCSAGPCQTAQCAGDQCVRNSLCKTGESCCAGQCVPAGCNDGNPCTDDSCGPSGCTHVNNSAACDDGLFCNGSDTCSGGDCSAHSGNPCAGSAVCDEKLRHCTGCLTQADCGGPVYGSWGSCGGFAGTCSESGTHSRSVTTFACSNGKCIGSTSTESGTCTRNTDGATCGTTSCGTWSSCNNSDVCAETGTHTRTCTDYLCQSGKCAGAPRTESQGCTRNTDGNACSAGNLCEPYGTAGNICSAGICHPEICPLDCPCDTAHSPSFCEESVNGAICTCKSGTSYYQTPCPSGYTCDNSTGLCKLQL